MDTLRDTLADLVGKADEGQTIEVTPVEQPAVEPVVEETQAAKDRARDEAGRFVSGEKQPEVKQPEVVTPVTPVEVKRPQRPSSWKKDYWDDWEKIDPKVAEYINQRESEYAKGVSTYKSEFDQAKPVLEAIAPHRDLLTQHGIDPAKQIDKYFTIHRTLALGSPEQKLAVFQQMAADYQIPLQGLFRMQDGQVYLNQPPPPAQPDLNQLVERKFLDYQSRQEISNFVSAKDANGNPLRPHYEAVRSTMSQLLESGLANDLPGAYETALRLPQHRELFDEMQKQQTQQTEAQQLAKVKAETDRAKRAAVSIKGQTPQVSSSAKKGLRSTLEDAFAEVESRV